MSLSDYVVHADGCAAWPEFTSYFHQASKTGACTCGLDAELARHGQEPPAPDERDRCKSCSTLTWCDHFNRCLAESLPEDLAPAPDVEALRGLVRRMRKVTDYWADELESLLPPVVPVEAERRAEKTED